MGKMLKRLDNHIARSHKGVTRAMNDRQPPRHFASHNKGVICQFPNCHKEVLQLDKHVKNMHVMKMREYYQYLKFGTEEEQRGHGVDGGKREACEDEIAMERDIVDDNRSRSEGNSVNVRTKKKVGNEKSGDDDVVGNVFLSTPISWTKDTMIFGLHC